MKSNEETERCLSRSYLHRIFNRVDTDQDGRMSYRELHEYVQRNDGCLLPKAVVGIIRERADRNDGAMLNFNEFIGMVNCTRYNNPLEKYLNKYMKILLPPPSYGPPRGPPKTLETVDVPRMAPLVRQIGDIIPAPSVVPRRAMATSGVAMPITRMAFFPEERLSRGLPVKVDSRDLTFSRSMTMAHPAYVALSLTEEEEDSRPKSFVSRESRSIEKLLVPPYEGEEKEDVFDEQEEHVYSCKPPKLGMVIISLVEIMLFVVDSSMGYTWREGTVAQALMYNPMRRKEVWRYLTYMLVHTGVWHLCVNVLIQLMLGVPLEMAHEWWCVIIVYSCGVIAGSLGSSVTNSYAWLAGASGGVYALITAHIISVLVNWKRMNYPVPQLCAFLVVICADMSVTIINFSSGNADHSISYAAHFFGGLAGFLVGAIVLKNYSMGRHERIVGYFIVTLCILLVLAAVIYNIVADHNFPRQHL